MTSSSVAYLTRPQLLELGLTAEQLAGLRFHPNSAPTNNARLPSADDHPNLTRTANGPLCAMVSAIGQREGHTACLCAIVGQTGPPDLDNASTTLPNTLPQSQTDPFTRSPHHQLLTASPASPKQTEVAQMERLSQSLGRLTSAVNELVALNDRRRGKRRSLPTAQDTRRATQTGGAPRRSQTGQLSPTSQPHTLTLPLPTTETPIQTDHRIHNAHTHSQSLEGSSALSDELTRHCPDVQRRFDPVNTFNLTALSEQTTIRAHTRQHAPEISSVRQEQLIRGDCSVQPQSEQRTTSNDITSFGFCAAVQAFPKRPDAPARKQIRKCEANRLITLTNEQKQALRALRNASASATLLRHPQSGAPLIIFRDAREIATGWLRQSVLGQLKSIALLNRNSAHTDLVDPLLIHPLVCSQMQPIRSSNKRLILSEPLPHDSIHTNVDSALPVQQNSKGISKIAYSQVSPKHPNCRTSMLTGSSGSATGSSSRSTTAASDPVHWPRQWTQTSGLSSGYPRSLRPEDHLVSQRMRAHRKHLSSKHQHSASTVTAACQSPSSTAAAADPTERSRKRTRTPEPVLRLSRSARPADHLARRRFSRTRSCKSHFQSEHFYHSPIS